MDGIIAYALAKKAMEGKTLPTVSPSDAGKVPVATDQGSYTLGEKADKPAIVTTGTAIMLADNTIYNLVDVTTLDITFPELGSYHAYIKLAIASSGEIAITLPSTAMYIGAKPTFAAGEVWELDIMDGIVVAGKAVASS